MSDLEQAIDSFLFGVIPCLLDQPNEITINKTMGHKTVVIVIKTPETSKLIGKNGKTVKAIQQILGAICAKHGSWVNCIIEG